MNNVDFKLSLCIYVCVKYRPASRLPVSGNHARGYVSTPRRPETNFFPFHNRIVSAAVSFAGPYVRAPCKKLQAALIYMSSKPGVESFPLPLCVTGDYFSMQSYGRFSVRFFRICDHCLRIFPNLGINIINAPPFLSCRAGRRGIHCRIR